jgi:hypothetical protein
VEKWSGSFQAGDNYKHLNIGRGYLKPLEGTNGPERLNFI